MRAKSAFLLMLALGCGLVASIGITQVMSNRDATAPPTTAETEPVFVAAIDISMGDPLAPQMMRLEDWPKDKVPPGALTKIEDIEGRWPKTKIYSGSPLLDNQLLSKGASDQGATGLIPKGYRVVSVKVDAVSSGSSLIRPGDRVDVLAHLEKSPSKNIPETCVRTFLQDIKVFAVNDIFALDSADDTGKSIKAQTVSLLVTPDQAEKVMLASELGRIRLVMRSPEDDQQTAVQGASPQELFGIADGANRDEESLLKPAEQTGMPSEVDDFLELLNTQNRQPSEAADAAPRATETWAVRLLAGSDVKDTLLIADRGEPQEGSDSGRSTWKVGDGSQNRGPSCAASAPQPPSVPSAEQPEDGQPEDDQLRDGQDPEKQPAVSEKPKGTDA